jgi:uncharacterized protein DUF4353
MADLTIAGTGSLDVNGQYNDGIVSKDGLVLAAGNVTVKAADDGMNASGGASSTTQSGGGGSVGNYSADISQVESGLDGAPLTAPLSSARSRPANTRRDKAPAEGSHSKVNKRG